jgi:hypothetical protein
MVSSGQFCALDNGALANFKKYGQPKPPQYSLDVVKVPVATYWSKNDMLAEPIVRIFQGKFEKEIIIYAAT